MIIICPRHLTIIASMFSATLSLGQAPILIADFESKSFRRWTAEGDAFGKGPARDGTEHGHRMVGTLGVGFASSTIRSHEQSTGTLISQPFVIKRNYIHFLLGAHEIHYLTNPHEFSKLRVQLLIDDKVVRTTRPNKFHAMFWEGWGVAEFNGMKARIRIVDKDNRSRSHIDVDHIIQSDMPMERTPLQRTLTVTKPILNLPVKAGNPRYYMELVVDGKKVRDMDIELAVNEDIDYWVFSDLSPWLGKEIVIHGHAPPIVTSDALDRLRLENHILDSEDLYRERLRPQFHFSTKRGWINDPNGLVYYDGEYHLYYQHNPYGWDHSRDDMNKHWGHAISTDLVHWSEMPDAIHPDQLGSIYSGSAVVDKNNTTGFQTGVEEVLVALYTSAGGRTPWSRQELFTQSIAYSNDRGRTFTRYEGNPVQENIEYINRDPKAIWHEPSSQWIIVLHFDERAMAFFTSKDLKSWKFESELENSVLHDCPELFQLSVDGNESNKKWILYGGSGDYLIGEFDGKRFTRETKEIRFNYGNCFYASQTFNNMPETENRRIQIAWGRVPMQDMPFNQQMLFPVELSLNTTEEGLRMFAYPVKEIEKIRGKAHSWNDTEMKSGYALIEGINEGLFDIDVEFEVGKADEFGFLIDDLMVVYNVNSNQLSCGDQKASLRPKENKIRLRLLVDRTTLEIYANDGRVYMPVRKLPAKNHNRVEILARRGRARINFLNLYELNSIWK